MLSHAQEPSECHALILVKGVGRNFPRRQPCVHVSVERKALLIDQAQRADRSYEFRQRRRLKLAVGSQAIAVGTCDAIWSWSMSAMLAAGMSSAAIASASETCFSAPPIAMVRLRRARD